MSRNLKSTKPPDLTVTPPPKPSTDYKEELYDSISKIAVAVNKSARHTEQIPTIRKKVEAAREDLVKLDAKLDFTTERVAKIENKVDKGHDCYQIDSIAEIKDTQRRTLARVSNDALRAVEHETKILSLSKDVITASSELDDMRKGPRRLFYSLIGVILTIVTSAMGAVWFISRLTTEVEHEQRQRTEQYRRLENEIKTMSKKADNTPVRNAIESLGSDLEDSYSQTRAYESLCIDMGPYEKRIVKNALSKRDKKIPVSCQR